MKNFEAILAAFLAHSVVFFTKLEFGNITAYNCGGDPPAPTTTESMDSIMQAYTKNFPAYLQSQISQIKPAGEQILSATADLAPKQAQQQLDQFKQFGPQYNEVGSEINRQNALNEAENARDVVSGPGRELVQQARETSDIYDKPWFDVRDVNSQKIQELLKSIDINKLTGSEEAQVERGVNRENASRGTAGAPSQIDTIRAAGQFGDALNKKKAMLGEAITAANQFTAASKSGVDTFQVATGKPSAMNTGQQKLDSGLTDTTSDKIFGMSNGFMSNLTGLQSTAMGVNANRRSGLDVGMGAATGAAGIANACCFIFLESNNGTLPWWVRKCRDAFYTPTRRKGYVRMSAWLVPLMERSTFIKQLVNDIMVSPMTAYGGWLYSVDGYSHGRVHSGVTKFWFKVWDILGKI